jgi:hypothetical protein
MVSAGADRSTSNAFMTALQKWLAVVMNGYPQMAMGSIVQRRCL